MKILITGGAGYIGSHMARMLVAEKHKVVVLDTLEYGHRRALPSQIKLVVGNVGDRVILDRLFKDNEIEAVMHFAGYISVEESVNEPLKYFRNNLNLPLILLQAMEAHKINKLIFSSTAAVYGNPIKIPIPENHPNSPTNPYGLSKWQFEQILDFFAKKNSFRFISLRYFNACGASLDGKHGEDHVPETHIIPLALRSARTSSEFLLYGADYVTRDGTCERDYIHIEDLCRAHILALGALINGHKSAVYNVGTGQGETNREVIQEVKRITKLKFSVKEAPRRTGDAPILVADPSKIKKEFGWKPGFSDLTTIIKSAWMWHSEHPRGYADRH